MSYNIEIGKRGEEIATSYLKDKGYLILARNYRSKYGEIDIIAKIKGILVFIEVKTRRSLNFGYAYEAVNKKKQRTIRNSSMAYLQNNRVVDNIQLRYDIIEVYILKNLEVNHIENAF